MLEQRVTHRHLIGEALSWLATAMMLVAFAYNFQSIRRFVGETMQTHAPVHLQTATTADEAGRSGDGVVLRADRGGHFEARIEVNGRPLEAMVDTGATIIMLTYEDAQRAGIFLRDRDFTIQMQTANGIARAAPVMLDRVSIGPIQLRNVQAGVSEPGLMRTNLLGMSFLKRLRKFEISSGNLILQD